MRTGQHIDVKSNPSKVLAPQVTAMATHEMMLTIEDRSYVLGALAGWWVGCVRRETTHTAVNATALHVLNTPHTLPQPSLSSPLSPGSILTHAGGLNPWSATWG